MSLCILFHFLCAQHVSDINISIIRTLRLCCWITTLVVLFLVRCVLEFRCGWVGVVSVLQAEACNTDATPTKNNTTNVVIQQNSRKLLMMHILMSEIYRAHKKWNKISSDIKLVFYSSTVLQVICASSVRNCLEVCLVISCVRHVGEPMFYAEFIVGLCFLCWEYVDKIYFLQIIQLQHAMYMHVYSV